MSDKERHPSMSRLLDAAAKRNVVGPAAIASKLGVSDQVVTNWSGRGVSKSGAIKAQQVLGISSTWVTEGEGATFHGETAQNLPAIAPTAEPPSDHANVAPGPDLKGEVPLISWVKAGTWGEAADPFQPGDAESWLDCPVKHSKATYALRVRGDSMTAPSGNSRTYPEGCVIFVDPEKRSPVNGDRVIAKLKGTAEVTFKVYKNEDGRQWLQPLNPSHEPIREEFKILGKVLGKWEDG